MSARTEDGWRYYAIGDIHGCADLLAEIHRKIVAHANASGDKSCAIVYVGDYVDRGPDSRMVIEMLMDESPRGFEKIHLGGNHEELLLDFLENRKAANLWLQNGGEATLESYGVKVERRKTGRPHLKRLHRNFIAALPDSHRRFLESLRPSHTHGDYFFAHAGVRPGVPLDKQDPVDLAWIRGPFLKSNADFGKVVIHGHTVKAGIQERANRIGIDTGAVVTGVLTSLVLDGEERSYLRTGDPGF